MMTPNQLAHAFESACMLELQALKPGNVHIFADGHRMTVNDFVLSAKAVAAVIAQPELPLGKRVLLSIHATQEAVACNTNLGIVLLCAPLIQAQLEFGEHDLHTQLLKVLANSTKQDAQDLFDAIGIANPAGLGQSKQHDVNQSAQCTLLEAMQESSERDLIARQYTNGFLDIFEVGLTTYLDAMKRFNQVWATTILHLTWMSNYLDSHVVRKYGEDVAMTIQSAAKEHLNQILSMSNPKQYQKQLLRWDAELKCKGINPGTSADMTVATLFLAMTV